MDCVERLLENKYKKKGNDTCQKDLSAGSEDCFGFTLHKDYTNFVKIRIFVVIMDKNTKTVILGSCFSDGIGTHLKNAGYDVCINPFGTLFNPASIAASIERLANPVPFTSVDCVAMGAGAGKICSFCHHTSFARVEENDFLDNANSALEVAARYFEEAETVIVTLGTSFVWKHLPEGRIVSNCLKRPGYEFSHERLALEEVKACLDRMLAAAPGKEFIFTVSPIRHLWKGAHSNQISKATLLLAIENLIEETGAGAPGSCAGRKLRYFPAYEIVLDDLRDYSWYAADKVHPSPAAVDTVWERFREEVLGL